MQRQQLFAGQVLGQSASFASDFTQRRTAFDDKAEVGLFGLTARKESLKIYKIAACQVRGVQRMLSFCSRPIQKLLDQNNSLFLSTMDFREIAGALGIGYFALAHH